MSGNDVAFERARRIIPGGVSSPVRAFGSVGGSPIFIDRARGASDLMVFESHNMAGGPVATVHLPALVPYGFHGWWLPDELRA